MRRRIQTTQGELTLVYEGGGAYRAPLQWASERDYVVLHKRQQSMFEVIARKGKITSVIGSGDSLAAACEIIRNHAESNDLFEAE